MHIGHISTRIADTDGVSPEIAGLATILGRPGHDCCRGAGELEPQLASLLEAQYP